jgi:hypothetical protein
MSDIISSPRLANSGCVVAGVSRDGGSSGPSLRIGDGDAIVRPQEGHQSTRRDVEEDYSSCFR